MAGTLLAGFAPLALGPVVLSRIDLCPAAEGVWSSLSGQARRPLQIETIGSAGLLAVEVEPCRTVDVPAYTLDVRLRALRP